MCAKNGQLLKVYCVRNERSVSIFMIIIIDSVMMIMNMVTDTFLSCPHLISGISVTRPYTNIAYEGIYGQADIPREIEMFPRALSFRTGLDLFIS